MKSGQGSYGEKRIVISSGLLRRSLNLQATKETPYYLFKNGNRILLPIVNRPLTFIAPGQDYW